SGAAPAAGDGEAAAAGPAAGAAAAAGACADAGVAAADAAGGLGVGGAKYVWYTARIANDRNIARKTRFSMNSVARPGGHGIDAGSGERMTTCESAERQPASAPCAVRGDRVHRV